MNEFLNLDISISEYPSIFLPSIIISPSSALSRVLKIFNSVDFPDPDLPTTVIISPPQERD